MAELRITSPHDGDLLNFHDGRQTERGLTLTVRGTAPPQSLVTVNGLPANADAGRFAAEVTIDSPTATLTARCGEAEQAITVYWDAGAVRRYRFSTDDNVYWLKDLATSGHRSLFDNPYLSFWRELHERYGNRVQHNIYWSEPEGFDLPQMPERYRGEFADNADWLKLTFHAEQNDPAKPYLNASAEQLGGDYDKVTNEILRFAGEASLSQYTTVHWGEATFDGCRALAERGVRGLAAYCHSADEAAPDGQPAGPRVSYYLDLPTTQHLAERDAWRCHRSGLWFIKHDLVCNTMPPEAIRPHLDSVFTNPHRRELMEVMIHEQYFLPFLVNYQPDVKQRVVEAVEWLAEHDYRPIYFDEGFLGSPQATACPA